MKSSERKINIYKTRTSVFSFSREYFFYVNNHLGIGGGRHLCSLSPHYPSILEQFNIHMGLCIGWNDQRSALTLGGALKQAPEVFIRRGRWDERDVWPSFDLWQLIGAGKKRGEKWSARVPARHFIKWFWLVWTGRWCSTRERGRGWGGSLSFLALRHYEWTDKQKHTASESKPDRWMGGRLTVQLSDFGWVWFTHPEDRILFYVQIWRRKRGSPKEKKTTTSV